METEITSDWIDRYHDDDLNEIEKAIFMERLKSSPILRSEVKIDASLNRFLMDGEVMDLMAKVRIVATRNRRAGMRTTLLLMAAAVLCLVLTGGLFYLLQHKQPAAYLTEKPPLPKLLPTQETCHDTTVSKFRKTRNDHVDILAKRYIPLAEFELLCGSVTRSHLLNMVTPPPNTAFQSGTRLLFSWKFCTEMVPVSLIIIDNQGNQVSEVTVDQTTRYLLHTGSMDCGLYYWKIIVDDDLIQLGKFAIYKVTKTGLDEK